MRASGLPCLGQRPDHEIKLILACCRRHFFDDNTSQIRSLVKDDVDWPYLVRFAVSEKLDPLLYYSLNKTCPDDVPSIILKLLEERFRNNEARNVFLIQELEGLLDLLGVEGIAAVPFKGPVIAMAAYGDIRLRRFADLDIIVRERDFRRAKDILIAHGYHIAANPGWEAQLVHPGKQIEVDVHRNITRPVLPYPMDPCWFWSRLEPFSLCRGTVTTFCPSDMILTTCMQIVKDSRSRTPLLSKICDIAGLLSARTEIDWDAFLRELRSQRVLRTGLFGLELTAKLLGVPLSPVVSQQLERKPEVSQLTARAKTCLLEPSQMPFDSWHRFYFEFRIWDRPFDRLPSRLFPTLLLYAKRVFLPDKHDQSLVTLPQSLRFLYFVLRPFRLICRYVSLGIVDLARLVRGPAKR